MGHEEYEIQDSELPIGQYSYNEFRGMTEGALLEVVSESPWCLPDAAQVLTPGTMGNGWRKVGNLGRYAVTFYDNYTGEGICISVCPQKLDRCGEFKAWFYKLKSKPEQGASKLHREIALAEASVCTMECDQGYRACLCARDPQGGPLKKRWVKRCCTTPRKSSLARATGRFSARGTSLRWTISAASCVSARIPFMLPRATLVTSGCIRMIASIARSPSARLENRIIA